MINMAIQCDWTDRYPPESCPTLIMHPYLGVRMAEYTSLDYMDDGVLTIEKIEQRNAYMQRRLEKQREKRRLRKLQNELFA